MFYSLQYQCKYETRVHSAVQCPDTIPVLDHPDWDLGQPSQHLLNVTFPGESWAQGGQSGGGPPPHTTSCQASLAPPPPLIAADMLMMRNGEFRAWCLPQHARHKVTLRPWRILPQETKRKLIYENDNEHECSGKITILEFGEILLSLPPLGIKSEHFSENNLFSFFFSI